MNNIENLTDKNLLVEVALNAKNIYDRLDALEKLSDPIFAQKIYTDIAKNDENKSNRMKAADKLADKNLAQEIYADIAIKGLPATEAVEKLTDQKLLEYVAKNANYIFIRLYAADRLADPITSQARYADIAKSEGDDFLARVTAVIKLTDQNVLADIALNDDDNAVSKTAAEKIIDQNQLAGIAKNAKQSAARIAAIQNLTIQDVLVDIAKHDKDWTVRKEAALSLVNHEMNENLLVELIRMWGNELKTSEDKNQRVNAAKVLDAFFKKFRRIEITEYDGAFIRDKESWEIGNINIWHTSDIRFHADKQLANP